MQIRFFSSATAALAIVGAEASPASRSVERSCSLPVPVTVLHDFGYPSWCENLAIRSNGMILASRLDSPAVYQVNPNTGAAVEVASWNASEWTGALGISEGATDVFYVNLAAFFSQSTFVKTSGVNSIFKIDMNTFSLAADGSVATAATVTKVTDIPPADFLNGMTTLDEHNILTADVYNGVVYKVNVCTGAYTVAVDDPKMKFSYVADPPTNLGVNGIKIFDSYLYWSNTAAGFLAKIKINSSGNPTGTSSIAATNLPKADDFIIRSDGTVFVAQNQMDVLSIVYPGTSVGIPIAGSNISTILAGVSSGKFGRQANDTTRLYLGTSGALALPINGTVTVDGTVSYVDTACFS